MQDGFNFNHFSSFTVDKKKRKITELESYLNKSDENERTIKTKLNIGDIVKLKGRKYEVVVEYIDYEMKGIGKVDYAGRRSDGKEQNLLCIFNQNEIDLVVQHSNEISNNKEER